LADALRTNTNLTALVLAANDLTNMSCEYWVECLEFDNGVLSELNIDENGGMDHELVEDVMEWCKGNTELIMMRDNPDTFDLSIRSHIVRDCLFNKVTKEEIPVIAALVSNPSICNDYEFYERVSHICPPDRKSMMRKTKTLMGLLVMNKYDKAVRMVQRNFRQMKERQRVDNVERLKHERRNSAVRHTHFNTIRRNS
jgi:hypothetical protein